MPSRSKRTATIVVRPIKRGERAPTKKVLATLKELNHHAPLEELALSAPHLTWEDPQPWKQSSRARPKRWRVTRRNAGRDDGQTWVSCRFLGGSAIEPDWTSEMRGGYGMDAGGEWENEREGEEHGDNETATREHMEIQIMDIAKPARLRGPVKGYNMVENARRVTALEEAEWEEWDTASASELEYEGWEAIESLDSSGAASHSVTVRQLPR